MKITISYSGEQTNYWMNNRGQVIWARLDVPTSVQLSANRTLAQKTMFWSTFQHYESYLGKENWDVLFFNVFLTVPPFSRHLCLFWWKNCKPQLIVWIISVHCLPRLSSFNSMFFLVFCLDLPVLMMYSNNQIWFLLRKLDFLSIQRNRYNLNCLYEGPSVTRSKCSILLLNLFYAYFATQFFLASLIIRYVYYLHIGTTYL